MSSQKFRQLRGFKNKKTIIIFVCLMCVIGFSARLLVKQAPLAIGNRIADAFSVQAITSILPADPRWALHYDIELEGILGQKFNYLTKGGQFYVFLSEDQLYVLKFFKQSCFFRSKFWNYKRLRKREKDFTSCKIAYDYLRDETGLLFVHLVPGDDFHRSVTLIDDRKVQHVIELGDLEFILQKYADPVLSAITNAMKEQKVGEAKKVIDQVFCLFYQRLSKGLADRDPAIAGNLGIIEGTAIQLDIGRFFIASNPDQLKVELKQFGKKNQFFSSWLQEQYPELYEHYHKQCVQLEKYYIAHINQTE